jgi:uncharacterized protein
VREGRIAHYRLLLFLAGFRLFAAGQSPTEALFRAIQTADSAALKRVLGTDVNVNAKDADGTPALMAATLFADVSCIQLLLDHGADPNVTNGAGATALMWAAPDLAKVKLLIAHGADVNARSANLQRTPLLVAASYPASVAVLQFLLEKGADLHAKDRAGIDALGRAARSADVEVVRFLAEHGCDPKQAEGPGVPRSLAPRSIHQPLDQTLAATSLEAAFRFLRRRRRRSFRNAYTNAGSATSAMA